MILIEDAVAINRGNTISKMVGNSASKPLKSIPNELEWWRIAWKKLYAFSRYTVGQIGITKYL